MLFRSLEAVYRDVPAARLPDLVRHARADVALAEHRWTDAVTEARACAEHDLYATALLAAAFDGRGDADSALAAYARFTADALVKTPLSTKVRPIGEVAFASAWRRIGELYEARHDGPRAIAAYEKFVSLWQRADQELQPQVRDVRNRIRRLRADTRRGR